MREIDTSDFHARRFNEQCRRDYRMFPRPHIDEVVRERVARVVSMDFISGCCDVGNFDTCLACGGDGGFDDTHIGRDHQVRSDYRECRECEGTGQVFHE